MTNIFMYEQLENKRLKNFIKLGQKVWVIPQNNLMRHLSNTPYHHVEIKTVTKIGTKYFYLDDDTFTKYGVEYGEIIDITNYCACYKVFLTESDFLIEKALYIMPYNTFTSAKIKAMINYFKIVER